MLVKQEIKTYESDVRVWTGRYADLNQSAHWHDDCELLYVESGNAAISVDTDLFHTAAGDAFFISGSQAHSITANGNCTLYSIMFDSAIAQDLFEGKKLCCGKLSHNYDLENVFTEISRELHSKHPYYGFLVTGKITRLMIDILRQEPSCEKDAKQEDVTFKRLLAEIDRNYEYFTFEDAARFMGLNPTYFSSLFHKCLGMTFSQYINCVKVEKAVALLKKSGTKITDAAMKCGFNTIRNFNRVFRQYTGYSPKQMPKDFRFSSGYVCTMNDLFDPNERGGILLPFLSAEQSEDAAL